MKNLFTQVNHKREYQYDPLFVFCSVFDIPPVIGKTKTGCIVEYNDGSIVGPGCKTTAVGDCKISGKQVKPAFKGGLT